MKIRERIMQDAERCPVCGRSGKKGACMKTILIIDDDVYIGDMLQEVLEKENYSVLRAYSGSEALFVLSSNRPDLVLLDLMLPGLQGRKCCRRYRGFRSL